MSRRRLSNLLHLLSFVLLIPAAWASEPDQRLALIEENDALPVSQDRHYTQGLLLDYLGPRLQHGGTTDRAIDRLAWVLPMFATDPQGSQRRLDVLPLGQSIFTPKDLQADPPDPSDRPYAGWLYSGIGLLQQNAGYSLHHLEVLAGVVGPWARAKEVQDSFHLFLGLHAPTGYRYQLGNRGGFQISYDYRRPLVLRATRDASPGIELMPELGFSEGNVFRYEALGMRLRVGDALRASYGPQRIQPALNGTSWLDRDALTGATRLNAYVGAQLRHVGYNAFIDRAGEVAPMGLHRKPWVADFDVGAELFLGRRFQVSFSSTFRTREFRDQRADDVFGSVQLSTSF